MATFHYSVKTGKRGTANEHSRYIARTGKYAQRSDDLIFTQHGNLPQWATTPGEFWLGADKFERTNGSAYKEIVLALPIELSPDQRLALVQMFIAQQLYGKTYQFAIHCPISALAQVLQPHVHIMYSDRIPDGIPRAPDQYFRRHNPLDPSAGGCKKDSGGRNPTELGAELVQQRAAWAVLMNMHLSLNGHEARVDHRSNRDRGISSSPGPHLGPARIRGLQKDQGFI